MFEAAIILFFIGYALLAVAICTGFFSHMLSKFRLLIPKYQRPILQQISKAETVKFKIDVRLKDQDYDAICGYTVRGYWKPNNAFFWRPMGVVAEKTSWGKYHPGMDAEMLDLTEKKFEELLRAEASGSVANAANPRLRVKKVTSIIGKFL